jgi:hypothetical protein
MRVDCLIGDGFMPVELGHFIAVLSLPAPLNSSLKILQPGGKESSPRRLSRNEHTLACFCLMGVALAAVEAELDETQGSLISCRDHNTYTLERLGAYNVVVAVMPDIGTNRTAAVAT